MKILKKIWNMEGVAGIGTLIVLVAMIIVAVIATAAIIHNANLLGQQAEKTSVEATKKAAQYEIVHIYGDRQAWAGSPGSWIRFLHIKVTLAAGSPAQDLEHLVVEIANKSTSFSCTYRSTVSAPDYTLGAGQFDAIELRDPEEIFPPFVSTATVVELLVNLTANGVNYGVQETLYIRLLPKQAHVTYEEIVSPDSFVYRYVDLY
jgi:flagellin-like protein